jgi:hypothetical protein
MSLFDKWFKGHKKEESEKDKSEQDKPKQDLPKQEKSVQTPLPWVEPTQNPFGVRLLDLRPVTQHLIATSKDPQMATNAVSYGAENGLAFIGMKPVDDTVISSNIVIPTDKILAPGVLFNPGTMEHKWAIYYHNSTLIFVRSWLRQVVVTAKVTQRENEIVIESITGKFINESPEFTKRILKFLLISHAIGLVFPAPLPVEFADKTEEAATWAFSAYGNFAQVGIFDETFDATVNKPLRSHSLLHIAVAQGNLDEIERQFQNGLSLELLAGDGLAPLHWALASQNPGTMAKLLELGTHPDSPSAEGATPLMNAVQSNLIHHVNLLLIAGANPNARDNRGFTALHRAAEMGHYKIAGMLLHSGADKNISANGHTALSFAQARGHREIIDLLEK